MFSLCVVHTRVVFVGMSWYLRMLCLHNVNAFGLYILHCMNHYEAFSQRQLTPCVKENCNNWGQVVCQLKFDTRSRNTLCYTCMVIMYVHVYIYIYMQGDVAMDE